MPRITDKPTVTAQDDDQIVIVQDGLVKLAVIGDLPTIKGDPGDPGEAGPEGPAGTGAALLSGTGIPSAGTGNNGDWYLRTTTGDMYSKAAGAWTLLMNLVGPAGPEGDQGPSGGSAGDFVPVGTGAVTRSMNDKMKEFQLNARDYGFLTSNTAADNKIAWDRAIAACKAADADLHINAGTFAITFIAHDKQVNIYGKGRNLTIIRPTTTSTHGMSIKQDTEFDAQTRIHMRGVQIWYNGAGVPTGYAGLFIQAKVELDDVYIRGFNRVGITFAPNDASVSGGLKGTIGNAPFFSILHNVWSRYNGSHGCWLRMGANVTQFQYCSFSNNGGHGFYHFNDSPDDDGLNGSTYGAVIIGGQCSYNTGAGYYLESGTNICSMGTYAEYNGSSNNTTANGYDTQPYDYYFGNNIVRTFFVIGVLLNADSGKVRLPPSSNTTCYVYEGGRALSVNIPRKAGTIATFNATTVAGLNSQLNTAFATLRAAYICS